MNCLKTSAIRRFRSAISRSQETASRRRKARRMFVEGLEGRRLLTGWWGYGGVAVEVQHDVPAQVGEVAPGDTVVGADVTFYGHNAQLINVVMPLQEGVDPAAVESATLWVDTRRNDGIVDRPVSNGRPVDTDSDGDIDAFSFTVPSRYGRRISWRGLNFEVHVTTADDAQGTFGFDDIDATYKTKYGRRGRGNVWNWTVGADNPTFKFRQEAPANLSISIDGPASQVFSIDTNDANTGNLTIKADEPLLINQLPILVETSTPVEDVQLRNIKTGKTFDAKLAFDGLDQDVYVVSGAVVSDISEWRIELDVNGTDGQDKDFVRTSVINDVKVGGRYWHIDAQQLDGGEGVQVTDGTISGNYHTILSPKATVVQRTMNATNDAVENEKHLAMASIDVYANDAADLLVTSLSFVGLGSYTDFQNFSVNVDLNGDGKPETQLEGGVTIKPDGSVTFDELEGGGFLIEAGASVRFTSFADRSSTTSGKTFQLELPKATPVVEVELADSGASMTNIVVNGAAESTVYSTIQTGTVIVKTDSTPVASRIHVGGVKEGTDHAAYRAEVTALSEAGDVTFVGLSLEGDGVDSIDRFRVFVDGVKDPIGIATRNTAFGSNSDFAVRFESRQFVVGSNESEDLIFVPDALPDTRGGKTGSFIVTDIEVKARGDISSNNITPDVGEVFARTQWIAMAETTSVENVHPAANGTSVFTGNGSIFEAKLTATSHPNYENGSDDEVIDGLILGVTSFEVTFDASGFTIANKADQTLAIAPTAILDSSGNVVTSSTVTGSFFLVFDDLADSFVNTEIDAGDSITLVVGGQTTSTTPSSVLGSSLRTNTFNGFDESFGFDGAHVKVRKQDADTDEVFGNLDILDSVLNGPTFRS